MWKSAIACALSILLANLLYVPTAVAKPSGNKEQRQLEKLKAGIHRLGTGPDARIKVKLKDKTQMVDAETGKSNIVAYPQVAKAKGNNLSSNEKLAITLVVVGVIAILILVTAPKD
jgi:hypothetical protein